MQQSASVRAGWAIGGLGSAVLLAQLGMTVANVGLPSMMTAFGVNVAAIQWVVLAYVGSVTVLAVFAGRLGDVFGMRRILLAGVATFTLASVACALAPNLATLVTARIVQGAGAAILSALGLAAVAGVASDARTGRAVSIISMTSSLGTTLGPVLGAFALAASGWRGIFWLNIPLGIATFAVLYAGLGSIPKPRRLPLFDVTLLRDPLIGASLLMSVLVFAVMISTVTLGPFALSRGFQLPIREVGLVMSAGPLLATLTAFPAGRLADRVDARVAMLAGVCIFCAGAIGLTWASPAVGLASYLVSVSAVSVGYALFQTSNNAAVLRAIAPERRGVISGALVLARNLGFVAGVSILGGAFSAVTRNGNALPAVVIDAMHVAFRIAAGFGVAAIAIAIVVLLLGRADATKRLRVAPVDG